MRKIWLAILLLSATRSQGQNALYNMVDASVVAGITAAFYASTDDTMRLGLARALVNYYSEGNTDSAIQNLPKANCFAANRDPHYAKMVLLGKGHRVGLKAESQEVSGSTFIIQLPLKYV
ncbi:MAG: hypothetical protein EOO88_56815 [Pedobacter sp.]|nr:MAG: hypothetical protein EOO88_56815 [Pedobacter sp.]